VSTSISPGDRVGRYQIRSKLGAGGIGEVHLSEDTWDGHSFLLFSLPEETSGSSLAIEMNWTAQLKK
jgi:hypothetical protein